MNEEERVRKVLKVLGIDKNRITENKLHDLKGLLREFDEESIEFVRNNPQQFFDCNPYY